MSIKVKINNDWVDTNIKAVRGVNHVNSEDVYTKEETEKKFATKTEVLTQINNSITKENIENTIEAWLEEDNETTNGEVYTKLESDALFSGKVNKTDIVQSIGTSTTSVMSQKAVSDIVDAIRDQVNNYKPIVIEGNVTNAADEEDLTSVNVEGTDVLKFKDKVYNSLVYSGLGRKILRKNIVNGVNTLTQSMINKQNTIYIIQYDFTLGENITVPANCIFEFDGGSLSSGNIIFTDTLLYGNIKFSNIVATGTIANDSITPKDFGALGDGVTNDTVAFKSVINICNNIHVTAGTYILSLGSDNDPKLRCIFIDRSNVHIKMDSDAVLKADETALEETSLHRTMIIVKGPGIVNNTDTRIENITIEGGKIIGSRSQYNLPDTTNRGENYCGIAIWFCNNVTIKNCIITDCAGDCIYTAAVDNLRVENVTGLRFRRSAVSIGLDNGVLIKGCTFDRPSPITYDNGNTSSGTSAPYTICFEPEPASLRKISDKPIQNVIIEDNTFIGDDSSDTSYIEGCAVGITIRHNIFKDTARRGIILQKLSSYGANGDCKNIVIENNIFECKQYIAGSLQLYYCIYINCDGDVVINGNRLSNMMLGTIYNYTNLIVENNITSNWDWMLVVDAHINDVTPKAIIRGNKSDATRILYIEPRSAVQDIYINNNILTGKADIREGKSFCFVSTNTSNVYIENNNATLHCDYIVEKSTNNIGKLLLKNNSFNCYPDRSFHVFNGNDSYVNADIIGNFIQTTKNGTLRVLDFTGKMNVINNVFAGAETKFTADTTDTDHLKINNNVYIGLM